MICMFCMSSIVPSNWEKRRKKPLLGRRDVLFVCLIVCLSVWGFCPVLVPLSPPLRPLDLLRLLPPFLRLTLGGPAPTDRFSSLPLLCNRMFGAFCRKRPLLFSRQLGISFRNPTLSCVLLSLRIEHRSLNPGFFKPIVSLLSLASFPRFSCKFPHGLPLTQPPLSADTPQISVKLRFRFSPGFCVSCQISSGLQCLTYPVRPRAASLTHRYLVAFIRPEPVVRTIPASSTHPAPPHVVPAERVPALLPGG